MEISDEYQDIGNPGGGVAMANGMSLEHHRHSPDSPLVSLNILFIFLFTRIK